MKSGASSEEGKREAEEAAAETRNSKLYFFPVRTKEPRHIILWGVYCCFVLFSLVCCKALRDCLAGLEAIWLELYQDFML